MSEEPRRAIGPLASFVLAAAALPSVAGAVQIALWPLIPPSPHLLFYPAVFAAARLRGARAGYVATAVSTAFIALRFLPPQHSLAVELPRDLLDLGIFVGVALAMSATLGRLEEAVARERAARIAADETWAMIAHDLRTPLGSIELASTLLVRRLHRAGGDLERAAGIIERATTRARTLLEDAVDSVKIADKAFDVEPGPCDLRELFAHVADAVSVAATHAGVRIDTDVATARAAVCDEPRIAQVLTNLVTNAIRFTPRGGTVSLVADDAGADVRISVRDTGAGIAPADLAHVFDKHWSRGGGGTGLGLWIARAIVRAHGRDLDVASELGRGTTFSLSLPGIADERAHAHHARV